jgi:hypothetical protein
MENKIKNFNEFINEGFIKDFFNSFKSQEDNITIEDIKKSLTNAKVEGLGVYSDIKTEKPVEKIFAVFEYYPKYIGVFLGPTSYKEIENKTKFGKMSTYVPTIELDLLSDETLPYEQFIRDPKQNWNGRMIKISYDKFISVIEILMNKKYNMKFKFVKK